MNGKLEQAIEAIKSGDKKKGREIIAEILKEDRNNEQAWLWVTQTDITHEQRIKSLKNVLKINPDNQAARQGLVKLQGGQSTSAPKGGLLKKSPSASEPVASPSPPIQDTKQCPYCAETIKAEAVVCRFCGNDLTAKTGTANQLTDQSSEIIREIIDEYINWRKGFGGWTLVSRDSEGAQFTEPKSFNPVLFWLGLLTCWIYGLGILLWIIGLLDYLISPKPIFYIDVQQMEKELEETKEERNKWF